VPYVDYVGTNKQAILDDPLTFLRQYNFSYDPVDCIWLFLLDLKHLNFSAKEKGCACMVKCEYYRELTQEEHEYQVLRNKFYKAASEDNVDQRLQVEWPWIVAFALLAVIAFTGESFINDERHHRVITKFCR
jgi:hypothetical protein